jgi:glycosyltransferase involved in cell wall biosynthesis
MNVSTTCIIPCYNEASRVGFVLQVFSQINELDQIICVDDGSTDRTADIIREFFPQILLLQSEDNLGKAAAVLWGAKQTQSDFLLLADTDLQNIIIDEFREAILAIKNNPETDMLILRRVKKDTMTRMLRGDITITGERMIRRIDLINALEYQSVEGFQIEVALNQYMMDRKKIVRWFPISAKGVISFRKMGFWQAVRKEILMFQSILKFIGISRMISQIRFLGREQL